jgi:acyl CoA:acetate/3-ketoacid CoA transferase alpha subunit
VTTFTLININLSLLVHEEKLKIFVCSYVQNNGKGSQEKMKERKNFPPSPAEILSP